MKFPLADVYANAVNRPPGYVEDVLAAGVVVGDDIEMSDAAYAALVAKYNPPSILRQVGSAAAAVTRWVSAGRPTRSEMEHLAVSVECSLCLRWDARSGRCLECGCCGLKHWWATESCPLGKW